MIIVRAYLGKVGAELKAPEPVFGENEEPVEPGRMELCSVYGSLGLVWIFHQYLADISFQFLY